MKIGVDIDDTMAQTTNYLMPLAIKFDKDVLHKNGIVDSTKDLPRCFDWNNDELCLFFRTVFENEVLNIPPMDEVKKVIKKLREDGNHIIIISSRNNIQLSNPYDITQKWLSINGIEIDKLIVNAKYKGPVVEEEKIDLLIDDSIGQCTFIADNNKIPVVLYAKKTNQIEYQGITRLENWDQIYNYIFELKNK